MGAGPYGLSLAANLSAAKIHYRIFGTPMAFWPAIASAGRQRASSSPRALGRPGDGPQWVRLLAPAVRSAAGSPLHPLGQCRRLQWLRGSIGCRHRRRPISSVADAREDAGVCVLNLFDKGNQWERRFDHVIAGTGFKVDVDRLPRTTCRSRLIPGDFDQDDLST